MRSTFSCLDGAPDGVDRLDPLERRVHDLERRDVLEVDDRARPPLERAQLVEHAVLRHLEEPGREAAAQREAREALVDAEEDLLRQILRERAVADEPEHVVEDGQLIGADDEREGTLIASLGLPQDAEIRLGQRQVGRSIAAAFTGMDAIRISGLRRASAPVISAGDRRARAGDRRWARGRRGPPVLERVLRAT